jgi:hypothetical protein
LCWEWSIGWWRRTVNWTLNNGGLALGAAA